MNLNRLKVLRLSPENILALTRGGIQTEGIPDDAVAVRCFMDDRFHGQSAGAIIAVVIASETFPEVPEGNYIEDLNVLCHAAKT